MSKQWHASGDCQRACAASGIGNIRAIFQDDVALIDSMEDYIRSNMRNNVTMNTMADYYCVSIRTLSRRLKFMEVSFRDIKARILKEVSVEMLLYSDSHIEQIAISTGYQNASNYVKAFKRLTGVTPHYYRKHLLR